MKPLNVGIVSIGGAGRAHLKRFSSNSESAVRAIFDPSEGNLRRFAAYVEGTGGYVTTNYENLLEDKQLDIISICSPDHTHFDYAIKAVEAGKHVLVEKPMLISLEECQKLQTAISYSDKVFGVHLQMRYVPTFVQARKVVQAGEIGVPFVIKADYIHDMRERAILYDNWRIDSLSPQKVGLGLSSHKIDLIRWILNDEVEEVFSYATHIGWPEYPDEDTVVTLLQFNQGAIATIISTIACGRPQLDNLVVYGSKGSIVNNLLLNKTGLRNFIHSPKSGSLKWRLLNQVATRILRKVKATREYPFSIYEHDVACQALIDEFVSCIQEGREFPINFSEGAYTVQICLAAMTSYEKGQPIQVKRLF